jgi:hypothetical protein
MKDMIENESASGSTTVRQSPGHTQEDLLEGVIIFPGPIRPGKAS